MQDHSTVFLIQNLGVFCKFHKLKHGNIHYNPILVIKIEINSSTIAVSMHHQFLILSNSLGKKELVTYFGKYYWQGNNFILQMSSDL